MEQEIITVKDLMVPLNEYATVSETATLYEAVLSLEKAQEEQDIARYQYPHRAILVFDENNKIVGKISLLDVLKALEPKYLEMGDMRRISSAGFSPQFLKSLMEHYALCDKSFTDMCKKANSIIVKSFMSKPSEGEYVEESTALCEAMHQFVMGSHQSLLVIRKEKITGILRLTDVFREVLQMMKTCYLTE